MAKPASQLPVGSAAAIAEEVLDTLADVEHRARDGLQGDSYLTGESIGILNPVRGIAALQTIERMNQEKATAFLALAREPAIARVVVSDESGAMSTYYVCRTSPPTGLGGLPLISYRSPMGAMASRAVGATFVRPEGREVELRQRAVLRPFKQDAWDSRDTVLESDVFATVTVRSLRELLSPTVAGEEEDVLAVLLAEEEAVENVIAGRRRSVITKMGLRDQPVLDEYQDGIFRLPLASRLLILGPPGTGKTTTLIRRLGQKLDVGMLDDEERELVRRMDATSDLLHANGWLMFTPTDLLRQYVKEAFAREGIAASEQRISTWVDHRHDLARNHFGILRTAAGGGIFVLKDAAATLTSGARERPTAWYEDFDQWQKSGWLATIRQAASDLRADPAAAVSALAKPALEALEGSGPENVSDVVVALSRSTRALQERITEMKAVTDAKIRGALTLQVNRNRAFLDELARFIDTLLDTSTDADEDDEDDGEEQEEAVEHKTGRASAVQAYQRSLRALARARAMGRSLQKGRRSSQIVEWLGERGLAAPDLAAVGRSLVQQSRLRKLLNPARSFINDVPRRYRTFRRQRQAEASWYPVAGGYLARDLHPLELDIVLLAILRCASGLLTRPNVQRDIDATEWTALRTVRGALRHQVLVDEATDFSPIQLACMTALANPQGLSFFACGDFNQRLTTWGSRCVADVTWACPGLRHETITISYRQSTQLSELGRAIVTLGGGDATAVALPDGVDNGGVPPVLAEGLASVTEVADWLAERVREIETFVRKLPSVAVLVMSEADVEPLAQALSAQLADNNIKAVACREGQTMGNENDVRVFDIQHIKGLEFEAVFFVGVDQLAAAQPDLFDKYLYVGTTRAATYLGMSCEAELPPVLEGLRSMFAQRW